MLMAATLSARLGWLTNADLERVRALLQRSGLALAVPRIGSARALGYMQMDKKVRDGRIAFVLARDIGAAFVARDVDLAPVRALLAEALAERAG